MNDSRVLNYNGPLNTSIGKSARERINTNVTYNQYSAENNIRK